MTSLVLKSFSAFVLTTSVLFAGEPGPAATAPAPVVAPAPVARVAPPVAANGDVKVQLDSKDDAFSKLDSLYFTSDSDAAPVAHEAKISAAIKRLGTSGWREAKSELARTGKAAIPFLIEAIGSDKNSFNIGGHTKSDSGRSSHQRPLAEICVETLTDIVQNRSNFSGEVPAVDQKAWQEWWQANGESTKFAR